MRIGNAPVGSCPVLDYYVVTFAISRTSSPLVVILMHAGYIFSTLFVLAPPLLGGPFLVYNCLFAVALWTAAGAAVLGANRQTIHSGRTAT